VDLQNDVFRDALKLFGVCFFDFRFTPLFTGVIRGGAYAFIR